MSEVETTLSALDIQIIDLFRNAAAVLGMPRSVGEIYGLLYAAPAPLSMEDIIEKLKISVGSASQGLKFLRSFGAVKSQYVPGERRDHFVVETELRVVVAGFIKHQVTPHLENGSERLASLRASLGETEPQFGDIIASRIGRLERWHKLATEMLPLIQKFAQNVEASAGSREHRLE